MTLRDLLGLPLSAAEEAAEKAHLDISRRIYTSAQGQKRLEEEKSGMLEDRVIGFRSDTLILGRFRTAQPSESPPDEGGADS